MSEQPLLLGEEPWTQVRDGNDTVRQVFDRHYSRQRYRDGRQPKLFVGPGEKLVLMSPSARAVFRNEGKVLSSSLIRAADAIADRRWPAQRHYTYVDARKIRSSNPGWCFLCAGWRRAGRTKGGLVILERPALDSQP